MLVLASAACGCTASCVASIQCSWLLCNKLLCQSPTPHREPTSLLLLILHLSPAESVDTTLLASVLSFLSCMSSVLWSLVVVVVVSPVMLAMLAPLSVCYYYLQVNMVACVCVHVGGTCMLAVRVLCGHWEGAVCPRCTAESEAAG